MVFVAIIIIMMVDHDHVILVTVMVVVVVMVIMCMGNTFCALRLCLRKVLYLIKATTDSLIYSDKPHNDSML